MLVSIVEFMDEFSQKRHAVAGLSVGFALLFVSLCSPILQAHHAGITALIKTSSSNNQESQEPYESPDVVTNAMTSMADDIGQTSHTMAIKSLSSVLSVASGVTHFDTAFGHGVYDAAAFGIHGVGSAVFAVGDVIGDGFTIAGHGIHGGFTVAGHTVGVVTGFFSGMTHVSTVIHPSDNTPTPTITQMRAQQAALIQNGTKGVSIPAISSGVGGACDSGEGNGGYPTKWCNAPMDSIATILYSHDPINRECTSYAYWYFTSIEGHASFRAWGNAKYWADTSNYPTRSTPAIGDIAVETAGAYGHVAIVQALPGQEYEGQTVPTGYVLVSEMNYDWNGHFRYSYSPLSKFSAYIY